MGLISDLIPSNYQAEKQRFLADPTFNPQFQYARSFSEDELITSGLPSEKYLPLARRILEQTFHTHTPAQIKEKRGELLTQEKVSEGITQFLQQHELAERYQIIWSENFVSRAAVTSTEIRLRLPCLIYKEDLEGLLYHELGTHVIRRVNYERQPWHKKKAQFGFQSHIKTEEGLAVLHSLLPKPIKLAYRSALNYCAVEKGQTGSFLDVWQYVTQYTMDPEAAFAITFRKKRGLSDTSQPGGFSKDLVYFEGFVDVTRFMLKNFFPLKELYFGKLALQDAAKAVELNPTFKPLLPHFYTDDPKRYEAQVSEIAAANFLLK